MPEAVPVAPAAATPTTPAAAPAKPPLGMEAALQLLAGQGAPTGPSTATKPETPAPTPAPADDPAKVEPAKPPEPSRAREFAQAAKKERALLDKQRALKAQEEQLRGQAAEFERMKSELDSRMKAAGESEAQRKARRDQYLRDPRLVLEDAGLTLEQLAEAVMRDGQPDPATLAKTVEERLKAVDDRVEERLKAREAADKERDERAEKASREAAQRERDEAEREVRGAIAATVKAEPKKYELINLFGKDAQALVYRAIETHYKETYDEAAGTGEVLSYEDACGKVESYLDTVAEGIGKTERFGSRFKPKEEPKPAPAGQPSPSATLGNVAATPTSPARKFASEEERMAAAVAAVQGALK
jgi:hypothetical protein